MTQDFDTSLQFATSDIDEPGSELCAFTTVVETGKCAHIVRKSVDVENLRVRLERGDRPMLDVEGFEMHELPFFLSENSEETAESSGESVEKIGDPSGPEPRDAPPENAPSDFWLGDLAPQTTKSEKEYIARVCTWLKDYLRAERVTSFHYAHRRHYHPDDPRKASEFDPQNIEPVSLAHVDGSPDSNFTNCIRSLNLSAETAKLRRVSIINVWQPLTGPVIDTPLALCCANTVASKDLMATSDSFGAGTLLRYSPKHHWCYLADQVPGEVLIFRNYDSRIGPDRGGVTPHGAFRNDSRPKKTHFYRHSFEVRCAVLY